MATLNLDYSCGNPYSDGELEDELLELFRQHQDPTELLERERRWPILYHLAPARRALLDWYPWEPTAAALEIGAGCGALTGLLCERLAKVSALELSERRSRIIFHRYQQAPGLEVIAGNVMDMPAAGVFDYVTLIGVLEYAAAFIKTAQPLEDLLRRAAAALKPQGRLLLAVENRYGIKYFAGAAEDHTGRLFDGIEGYPGRRDVQTFSKDELVGLLQASGYAACRWYYPYPDYKFPDEIFSDQRLPGINHKFRNAPNYDHDRIQLFDEKLALAQLAKNNRFDFFANAFLVEATKA